MSKPERLQTRYDRTASVSLEALHLQRELKTAVELAIVALAPEQLLEKLGASAALLEAISQLPLDSPPAMALQPKIMTRGRIALDEWRSWERAHLHTATA